MRRFIIAVAAVSAIVAGVVLADSYRAADRVTRPAPTQTEVLPERFLRGYDPITVTFRSDEGRTGPVDDASALAALTPSWPGAWEFVDNRTLQFRPAEPWPALQRFAVKAKETSRVLTTMMTPPTSMMPDSGTQGLPPFRTFTITFPHPLPPDALKKMVSLELRALPGLENAARRSIERFSLSPLPRSSDKDAAGYAVNLDDDVPEGMMLVVTIALALGDEDTTLWRGKLSTRTDFHLTAVSCGGQQLGLTGAPHTQADQALDCGAGGAGPALMFSAPVGAVSLSALKRLVRTEPSVPNLSPRTSGNRLELTGTFVPDTLYRLRIEDAPITDDLGRRLKNPGSAVVHFFVGAERPHLRPTVGRATIEQNGPRELPMSGYGYSRADVRIHRVDARHTGLWPFPTSPVATNEDAAPPFPGEEPTVPTIPGSVSRRDLIAHLALLGAPPVSRTVDLPATLNKRSSAFGLDIGKLMDDSPAIGARRPGTYLVGVRKLDDKAERLWTRVQVTNLSVTAVEERDNAVLFVTSLDTAEPVAGATVIVEGITKKQSKLARMQATTDASGRATFAPNVEWSSVVRVTAHKGDDVLVIDPRDPPPQFMNNHWSGRHGTFLDMLAQTAPKERKDDSTLGFLFTERPIYRPGEKVFLKGYVREKRSGLLTMPVPVAQTPGGAVRPPSLLVRITKPSGEEQTLSTTTSDLYGAAAEFITDESQTGMHTARLYLGTQQAPVAVRTFLVEAYRIPTFEVSVHGPSRARLDEPLKVRATARYYAGGSVVSQPIKWTVTRRSAWHTPKGREGFLWASSSQFSRSDTGRPPDATSSEAELSADGSHAVEIHPEKDLDGSPRLYRFEATVTGADDQQVSAVTEVLALPPFMLGMKLDRYKKEATEIVPEVLAVGVDDKPAAGQKVQVRLLKRTWHSHLRESHFATGEANYVTEMEDSLVEEKTVTTTAEPIKVPFATKGAGVYVVELVGKDKLGRVQTMQADLYIGGKEPQSWQKGQAGVFDLVADKKLYAPGDTANLLIKSPFQKARALVIIERADKNEYRHVDISGSVATIQIPVDAKVAPNLPVHVVISRGRVGVPKRTGAGGDTPYRPQTVASSIDLEIEPSAHVAKVQLTHPEQARPGETIDVTVAVTDSAGKPIAGEATVWLVDEAVLSLAKEGPLNPNSAMVVRNTRDTAVNDTRNSVLGALLVDEAPGGDGDEEDGDGRGRAAQRVRKNFQTVPFYQATVAVPSSGKVTLKVPLSDDLTNFKVRATVVSGAMRFGTVERTLKVRLPVIVQPKLPRFARQGDRFDGGGVARLVEGEPGAAVVKASYTGPVTERKRSKDIALKKDKAEAVAFPVEVSSSAADGPLTVKVEVNMKKGGAGDAFEVTIPIKSDIAWQTSQSRVTLGKGAHTLPGPAEPARAGTATQTITATHIPGLLEVFSTIDVLAAYPHGCLEQKMAQLAPRLSLAKVSKRLGGIGSDSVVKNVERLLQEFPLHQDETGLLAYWPGNPGDLQVTARALEFAAAAKEAGAIVDDGVMGRAKEALVQSLRSDARLDTQLLPWRQPLQATALRALARMRTVDDGYLTEALRARKNLDATGRAELALTLVAADKSSLAGEKKALANELWSSVVFSNVDGKRTVTGLSDPRAVWGGRLLGSSTSSLATVLEALVRLDPKNADLPLLFDAVLKRGAGGSFGSTYDSRQAVEAIVAYLDTAAPGGASSKLTLDKQALSLDDKNKVVRHTRTSDSATPAIVDGAPVTALVRWRSLPKQTGDRADALKQGLLVRRSMTIYPKDGGTARRIDDVRAAEVRVQQGDIIELHTTVTADAAHHHVALVVPFAAGLEPMNTALQTSGSDAAPAESDTLQAIASAKLDDENRYYVTWLNKGSYTVHTRVRATTPGSYTHPGAWAERMYDDSVRGRSVGSRIIVEASTDTDDN